MVDYFDDAQKLSDSFWLLIPDIQRIVLETKELNNLAEKICQRLILDAEIDSVWLLLKGRFGELSTLWHSGQTACDILRAELAENNRVPQCVCVLPYKSDYTVKHRKKVFDVDPEFCICCSLYRGVKDQQLVVFELIYENRLRGWLHVAIQPGKTMSGRLRDILKVVTASLAYSIDNKMILSEYNLMERQFRRVLENTGDAVIGLGLNHSVTFMNSGAVRMFGFSANELVGKPVIGVVADENKNDLEYFFSSIKNGGEISVRDIIGKNKAGRLMEAELTAWVEADQRNNPLGYIAIFRDVTQERQAITAFQESESRFKTLYENIPGGMLIIGRDYVISDVNSRTCDITGYSREELVGQLCDIVCPKGSESKLCPIWEEGQSDFSGMDTTIKCKDGERKPIIKNAKRIKIQGESYILENFQDVSELKATETALRESENQYRLLAENTLDCIFVLDTDFMVSYVNPALKKLFGYSTDEVLGTAVDIYFDPREFEVFQHHVNNLIKGSIDSSGLMFETWFKHKDGYVVPVEVTFRVLFNDQGDPSHIQGTARDITQRKNVEKDRERFLTAIDQAGEIIMISDSKGVVQYVNPAFESITGFHRDEVVGKVQRMFRKGYHPTVFYDELMKTIHNGSSWQGSVRNRRKNDTEYVEEISISPVVDENGNISHFISVIRDVTREIELEEQLRHSQKMEAVGELAGGVAHDFNNLLQVISGYLELLNEDIGEEHPGALALSEIENACTRATSLVSQMLAFSRRQLLRPQVLNLNHVINDIMKMLGRVIPESVTLEFSPGNGIFQIKADPGMIEQVLLNLVLNSKDAMPDGGTIRLKTENTVIKEEESSPFFESLPGTYVLLTVTDTGHGMTPEVRERIFEPFFTTKTVGKGTGLGLSMVYGLIKQHEGLIKVSSEPNIGTSFKIYLPISTESFSKMDSVETSVVKNGNETILIAEDNEMVRDMTKTTLEKAGYKVIETCNGQEAVEVFSLNRNSIDLLILDVVMPVMGGKQAADIISSQRDTVPIIFASGYNDSALQTNFILNQDVMFLYKPYTRENLLRQIRIALDQN